MESTQQTLQRIVEGQQQDHFTYVADAISDFVVDHGDRVYVFDIYGNKFLDMSAGDGVMVLGQLLARHPIGG